MATPRPAKEILLCYGGRRKRLTFIDDPVRDSLQNLKNAVVEALQDAPGFQEEKMVLQVFTKCQMS